MIIKTDSSERRLPDFFIVGAAKSATTSLYAYLKQHPQIFLPERKEMYFLAFKDRKPQRFKLTDGTFHKKVGCNADEYFSTYENCPGTYVAGDASTWYLYFYSNVIKNIKTLYGSFARSPKIIMVLRNPIERAWSHYCMHRRSGIIDISFEEAINSDTFRGLVNEGYYPSYDYLGFGMYYRQVKAYLDAFDQVKILLFEDMHTNEGAVINEVIQFLGLYPINQLRQNKKLNVSGKPKTKFAAMISHFVYRRNILKKILRPFLPQNFNYKLKMGISRYLFEKDPLKPKDRELLIDIYRNDILQLQELLGRDLSPWLAMSSKFPSNFQPEEKGKTP